MYGTFFMFSCVLLFFVPIIFCILPETKDLGLEVIHQYFTPPIAVWHVDWSGNQEDLESGLDSQDGYIDRDILGHQDL